MELLSTNKHLNDTRLAQRIRNRSIDIPFNVRLPNGSILRFGEGDPAFILTVNDHNALSAIARFDELRFTEAYINGGLDIEGEMWAVLNCREAFRDLHPLHHFWRRLLPFITGQLHTNEHAIHDHYEYESLEPYDAIVILGVMEHLPNYRAVLKQFRRLLRPGGKIYLDASSYREEYSKPTFISRYAFPGNHRYFCLHDFLSQV
ncbi:MAG: class I SAM-dependent methyltransferase [Arenicellales bacterium]|jgi:SAM-dependent methyltransferase